VKSQPDLQQFFRAAEDLLAEHGPGAESFARVGALQRRLQHSRARRRRLKPWCWRGFAPTLRRPSITNRAMAPSSGPSRTGPK